MKNPWNNINLNDYENHMKLESVMQLQSMNEIMSDQFSRCTSATVMILGIAGGNGLNHIAADSFEKIYGVDINEKYLDECVRRYPELSGIFTPIHCDLLADNISLPPARNLIANLFIEYVGYDNFCRTVRQVSPRYVSCVIQVNRDDSFVSDSPYLHVFDDLEQVYHQVDRNGLTKAMEQIGYRLTFEKEKALPNGKSLLRLDFETDASAEYRANA